MKPQSPNYQSPQAFTLVELLVVITIISIIAAILFPAFARARENARRANCQSNLRQIGLCMVEYEQDYDEKMPSVSSVGAYNGEQGNVNGTVADASWRQRLQPYVQNSNVFRCPSNRNNANVSDIAVPGIYTTTNYSYSINRMLYTLDVTTTGYPIVKLKEPATRVLVIDSNGTTGQYNSVSFNPIGWTSQNVVNARSFSGHMGTMNVLYADGHVKAMRPVATALPINQWGCTSGTDVNCSTPDATVTQEMVWMTQYWPA